MIGTYRLQLSPSLDLRRARDLVPYLRDLGVSHVYLSPALRAREGSTHGYDVVDPTTVSPALGGEEALRALAAEIDVVLDIVPNHMGVSSENRWWADEDERPKWFDYDPEDGWYRRFFDIDDLAGLRMEDPEVFAATHAKVLELARDGVVDGLRIDHPDGLADPAGYLRRLRDEGAERVWVEKILHPGEPLRADWPVSGTVGYEFCNDAQAVFVDPAGRAALETLPHAGEDFAAVALRGQREQASTTFAREVARLHRLAPRFAERELAEALARLPVYRTYVEPWSGRVDDLDRHYLEGLPEGLRAVLELRDREVPGEFVTRFQQTSPPVTAKGIEDTAFYRHLRLLALNEVGGDPGRFGMPVDAFHREAAARPGLGLLVTQTHDTKRSGDVRARIGALSEMAEEWAGLCEGWLRGHRAPDDHAAYLVLQTLAGCPSITPERLEGYVEKALREAKLATSWVDQDHAYEEAARRWAVGLLADPPEGFTAFAERLAERGREVSLAQQLLKLTVPGVPDVYQGDELEALSLVDPDNRRPVDWGARRAALERVRAGEAPRDWGERKLALIHRGLGLRARRPSAFAPAAAYTPLEAPAGVLAYTRGDGEVLVSVPVRRDAPALPLPTDLRGRWRDALSGDERTVDAVEGLTLLERVPG
jgi:(1->4)-alpha-D-glucan 1-alpha-D-glucosylmutase